MARVIAKGLTACVGLLLLLLGALLGVVGVVLFLIILCNVLPDETLLFCGFAGCVSVSMAHYGIGEGDRIVFDAEYRLECVEDVARLLKRRK